MELMSSLLLCALAALLQRTLDCTPVVESDLNINDINDTSIGQHLFSKRYIFHKTVLLNSNSSWSAPKNLLQEVYDDLKCKKCASCIEQAIIAQNKQRHALRDLNEKSLVNDLYENYYHHETYRGKRGVGLKVESSNNATKIKKSKGTKKSKGVTVTKFDTNGQLYALKIRETTFDESGRQDAATCRVYSVKKSFPCGTPEGDLLLTTTKRKASKKNKKDQSKKTATLTTEKPKKNNLNRTQMSRTMKREVGTSNTRIVEQYMTSIEELY